MSLNAKIMEYSNHVVKQIQNKKWKKKYSLSNSECKEYDIVSPFTVKEGICTIDETKTNNLGTNMECRFDNKLEKCMPKDITKCETYYKPADCYDSIIKLADKKQCIYIRK